MELKARMVNVEERVRIMVENLDGERTILNIPKSSLEIIKWLEENEFFYEECTIEELEENEEVRLG